jgi:hypothetical protein
VLFQPVHWFAFLKLPCWVCFQLYASFCFHLPLPNVFFLLLCALSRLSFRQGWILVLVSPYHALYLKTISSCLLLSILRALIVSSHGRITTFSVASSLANSRRRLSLFFISFLSSSLISRSGC